jgi:hypothetical protein
MSKENATQIIANFTTPVVANIGDTIEFQDINSSYQLFLIND